MRGVGHGGTGDEAIRLPDAERHVLALSVSVPPPGASRSSSMVPNRAMPGGAFDGEHYLGHAACERCGHDEDEKVAYAPRSWLASSGALASLEVSL